MMKNKTREGFLYTSLFVFTDDVNDSPFYVSGGRGIHDAYMNSVEFITGW